MAEFARGGKAGAAEADDAAGGDAFAQGVGVEGQQIAQVGRQIAGDDRVGVSGMVGKWGDEGGVAAPVAKHTRYVHQRREVLRVNHFAKRCFAAVFKEILKQARLFLFDEFGGFDGGVHVGHRIVGVFVGDAVGGGEFFQAEYRQAVFITRPFYAFGAQGVTGADDIKQSPT